MKYRLFHNNCFHKKLSTLTFILLKGIIEHNFLSIWSDIRTFGQLLLLRKARLPLVNTS